MNPYKIGLWVVGEDFYGRKSLISSLLAPEGGLIWIMGNRRVGKTSLLKQLQLVANASHRYVALFLEFTGAEQITDWTHCLRHATADTHCKSVLQEAQMALSNVNDLDFFALQRLLAMQAGQRGRKLLLLCDEVETWIDTAKNNPRLIQQLRKEWSDLADNLKVVIASTKRLWQLNDYDHLHTSRLLLHFSPHYIAALADEEANELIEQSNNSSGPVKVSPALRKQIKQYTGNHPFLIQKLCNNLYDQDQRSLRNVEKDDLVVDQLLAYCFDIDFECLSAHQQKITVEIALNGLLAEGKLLECTGFEARYLSQNLLILKQLGFVSKYGSQWTISNYFLREWLIANQQRLLQPPAESSKPLSIKYKPDLAKLRQTLIDSFNLSELHDLCFDLGIDYESLPGTGKDEKVRELIAYFYRRKSVPELMSKCLERRPEIYLNDTASATSDNHT